MKKVMLRVFWIWQFDKEEKWLNEMSAKGLQLRSTTLFIYTFDVGLPSEYIYRLELLDNRLPSSEKEKYIHFVEDTGAECATRWFNWIYFRKKATEGDFDLFSDVDSRIKHINRVLRIAILVMILNVSNALLMTHRLNYEHMTDSLALNIFIIALVILIGYGIVRLLIERRRLNKEKVLYE